MYGFNKILYTTGLNIFLTQYIEIGSCVLQLCLRHDIPVWQHIGQNITATMGTVAI